ncbi:MAG: glycosyltransferase family 39 protein, partial [Thermoanaerobaculia bacterium]
MNAEKGAALRANPPASPAVSPWDPSRWILWPALTFGLAVSLLLSWGRYFNQDEFESLHQGWLLAIGKLQYLDFNSNHPPLFFRLLSVFNVFAADPVSWLRAGRVLTWLSAGLQLVLVGRIARAVFGASAQRWALATYAVCETFLEWSVEIRSDALMVPLWLAAILLALSPVPMRESRRLFAIGLLL